MITCPSCTLENPGDTTHCKTCNNVLGWECNRCTYINSKKERNCSMCDHKRDIFKIKLIIEPSNPTYQFMEALGVNIMGDLGTVNPNVLIGLSLIFEGRLCACPVCLMIALRKMGDILDSIDGPSLSTFFDLEQRRELSQILQVTIKPVIYNHLRLSGLHLTPDYMMSQIELERFIASTLSEQESTQCPASHETIKSLTTKKASSDDCMESCPICLESFQDEEEITVLPCSHTFHSDCCNTWFEKHANTCPTCRASIGTTDDAKECAASGGGGAASGDGGSSSSRPISADDVSGGAASGGGSSFSRHISADDVSGSDSLTQTIVET